MSTQITTALRQTYSADVALLSQQKASRLFQACRTETLNAEFGYFDQVGSVTAVERFTRHADTPFTEIPFSRRQVRMRDFELSDIIDKQDKVRMAFDPGSPTMLAFAAAQGRQLDQTVIDAYFGTAYTGKTGATSTVFLAGNQIANNYVESGGAVSSGLTVAKLRKAKELLDAAEAGVDPDEARFIACTSHEVTNLLRQTEITSADYNNVKALVNGDVGTFMGFKFIRTELVPLNASSYRRVMAWVKSGVLIATGDPGETNAEKDPTKGFNTRIHTKFTVGATRMEEAKAVEIICDPAA